MVRVNLIHPSKLADQHLIAEYNEILMLVAYVRKFPALDGIPKDYVLGKGHIKFFKNKLGYLQERHKEISGEMLRRNFKVNKKINVEGFGKEYFSFWEPKKKDFDLIKKRIVEKINLRPDFYRYCGEKKEAGFFVDLLYN